MVEGLMMGVGRDRTNETGEGGELELVIFILEVTLFLMGL